MHDAPRSVHLFAVGDVGPIHEPLGPFSELVEDFLKRGDLRFAQCERIYSELGSLQVHSNGHNSRQPPRMIEIFPQTGFNVVSLAGNHAMDWGAEALLDTKRRFESMGISTTGAGMDRAEASEPAILDLNGVRVGFLAYCSILRDGYEATSSKPGVLPMRAHTFYERLEVGPGLPPRIITIPFDEDLDAMSEDVARTLERVDVVICSFHWGINFMPKLNADYQGIVARAAIKAGASLVLGHHQHVPKGIEVIDGRVCFHGLGNFMFTTSSRAENRPGHRRNDVLPKRYGIELDPDYPTLPYGRDGVKAMVASVSITAQGLERVGFLPALIDKRLRTEILSPTDPRFAEEVAYIDYLSSDFQHSFRLCDNEILVD